MKNQKIEKKAMHYVIIGVILSCFIGLVIIISEVFTFPSDGSIAVTTPIPTKDFVLTYVDDVGGARLTVGILHDSANNQDYIVIQNDRSGSICVTPRLTGANE